MADKSFQPTLAGLRAFVAVAETRHFGGASAALGVSQSTLSQSLAALESGLGTLLVERSTRRVFLTQVGEQLLPLARSAVEAADVFAQAAGGVQDPLQGEIRLGLIPTVAPYILPAVLSGLANRLPGLALRIVEDQTDRLLALLRAGSLDAALLALPADGGAFTEVPVYEEDFVLALSADHALSDGQQVPVSALAGLPLLLLEDGHCLRDQALEVCQLAGFAAELADTRATSLTTAVQCVVGGLGATLIPETAVTVESARGGLGLARFASPSPSRRIGLVFRTSSGRDEAYRQLAALIGELVAAEHSVRLPR